MIREQFTPEQRTKLLLEYNKLSGTRNFWPVIFQNYMQEFPASRLPSKRAVRNLFKKQNTKFTMHNCNSKTSPGGTWSGRRRTVTTERVQRRVKRVMDRDPRRDLRNIGRDHSPINTGRRNCLGISRASWHRNCSLLKYHPYKAIRQQKLKDTDFPRRVAFCNWILPKSNEQLANFLFSDEANFDLSGNVNSQNVRMYAPSGSGRPENLVHEKSVSQKLMVFCGIRTTGIFGLKFYQNEKMNGAKYHRLLQYNVLPELREVNGGNLNNLTWTQDGAPCHTARANIAYLNRQFDGRVVSKGADREWPPRSPDLNPCDFFLWGYLKSKVYYPKPNNMNELQQAIEREIRQLSPDMCRKAVLDLRNRAENCINKNGKCFEN